MEHVPKDCSIEGCQDEATHWIDTSEGFYEGLSGIDTPETFYICDSHKGFLANPEDEMYYHLRIDTHEMETFEIGIYSCSEECRDCNR
jgi:hypothetical protein